MFFFFKQVHSWMRFYQINKIAFSEENHIQHMMHAYTYLHMTMNFSWKKKMQKRARNESFSYTFCP